MKDPQCRLVLLGATGDWKYLMLLQTHPSARDKVTYIQGSLARDDVFQKQLNIVVFSQLFEARCDEQSTSSRSNIILAKTLDSGVCLDFQRAWLSFMASKRIRTDKYRHNVSAMTANPNAQVLGLRHLALRITASPTKELQDCTLNRPFCLKPASLA